MYVTPRRGDIANMVILGHIGAEDQWAISWQSQAVREKCVFLDQFVSESPPLLPQTPAVCRRWLQYSQSTKRKTLQQNGKCSPPSKKLYHTGLTNAFQKAQLLLRILPFLVILFPLNTFSEFHYSSERNFFPCKLWATAGFCWWPKKSQGNIWCCT